MSNRINELFGSALDYAVPETWTTITPAQLHKIKFVFAQLLLEECTELTIDYKNDDHYSGWIDYRDAIRKHFGIE